VEAIQRSLKRIDKAAVPTNELHRQVSSTKGKSNASISANGERYKLFEETDGAWCRIALHGKLKLMVLSEDAH